MKDKVYKNILWWGMAALLIFTPLARGAVRVWSVTPVLLISYTLIFLWLWRENNSNSGTVPSLRVPMIAFAVLAVISFAFSIYKHDSFYALLRLGGYIGIYYIVASNFDRTMRRRVIDLVILMTGGLSLYGILQYFGVFGHSWWNPARFLAATYVNHNHFAGYLEMVIPVAVALLIPEENKGYRFRIGVLLVIMLIAFILTQSRGAWVSLLISLAVMNIALIRRRIWSKKSFLILLLCIACAFSLAYLNEGGVAKRIDTMVNISEETLPQTRFKIWQGAWGMVKARPLVGFGIGNFDAGFYKYRPEGLDVRAYFAHNDYLHMAAEMGVLAPFIMLWLFIAAIRTGFSKEYFSCKRLGCAIGIMSLALHAFVDFNFHIPANMLLFTIWMAVASSRTQNRQGHSRC